MRQPPSISDEPATTRFGPPGAASLVRGAAVLVVLGVLGALAISWRVRTGTDLVFLRPHPPARWVEAPGPFFLGTRHGASALELAFTLPPTAEPVRIDVWATGEMVGIREEGRRRAPVAAGRGTAEPWSFRLAAAPRPRRIVIGVLRQEGPAVAAVNTSMAGVASGREWQARAPGEPWGAAAIADGRGQPALARHFPSAPAALASVAPIHLPLFAGLVVAFAWGGLHRRPRFGVAVRWLSLGLVTALAIHNLVRLPLWLGFDLQGHLDYIQRLARGGGLPRPGDGWQMFQAPLYYLLSAALAIPLESWFSSEVLLRGLRVISLAAGIAQVELSYRASRLALPGRPDLQAVGTLVGGFLPMNLYMSQYVGNEPLAGVFAAGALVATIAVVARPERMARSGLAWGAGVTLGLALLTKVSAVVLAPVIVAGFAAAGWRHAGVRLAARRVAEVSAATAAVAGWYYVRTWILVGTPFVGGWDPSRGIVWWQDPGYRTWDQLLSFGRALHHPIYAATAGIWDSLWSSLWTDSFLGSIIVTRGTPPWNLSFVVASTLLSVVPAACLGLGIVYGLDPRNWRNRGALLVAVAALGAFLSALLLLYLKVPIYSTAKATYTLGATPAYALLAAAGASLAARGRWTGAVVLAALVVWASNAWLGYWVT